MLSVDAQWIKENTTVPPPSKCKEKSWPFEVDQKECFLRRLSGPWSQEGVLL